MISLRVRSHADEQMDDPALDPAVYGLVLRDLARVNRVTLAARPTLAFLKRALGRSRSFRLLDVGFGRGDMLQAIASWARRRRIDARLVGVDINPRSAAIARAATPSWMPIEYRTGDYRDIGEKFDFVVSSLVAHHMSEAELTEFLRFMEAEAKLGWMVNDLHRHRLAYAGYPVLARLLGVHPIVRSDGKISIARSFKPSDWRSILARADIPKDGVRIVRRFPLRLCVERVR